MTCCRREGRVSHLACKNPEQLDKESRASLIALAGVKLGVYVCIYMYICVYMRICISMCIYVHVCVYICTYAYIYI